MFVAWSVPSDCGKAVIQLSFSSYLLRHVMDKRGFES